MRPDNKSDGIYLKGLVFPLVFLAIAISTFVFSSINKSISSSSVYIIVNFVIFIAAILAFLYLFARRIISLLRQDNTEKSGEIVTFILVFACAAIFIFVKMGGYFTGRFMILPLIMGDMFQGGMFDVVRGDPRTYSSVIYSIIGLLPLVRITPYFVLGVNRILSVFLLVSVFLTARKVSKNAWIGLLVMFSFASFSDIRWMLSSIEYGLGALLFSTLSVFFLFDFEERRKIELFIMSCLCLVIASYYRYELSLIFGLSYLIYCGLFLARHRKTRIFMAVTAVILAFNMMAFLKRFTVVNDVILAGEKLASLTLGGYLANTINVLNNNLVVNKDLALSSGHVSIFLYAGLAISLAWILVLAYRVIRKRGITSENSRLYIFVFYILIFFTFQAGFHMEGFRTPKYHANYFLGEVMLVYYSLGWLIDRVVKLGAETREELKLSAAVIFFVLAMVTSNSLSFSGPPWIEPQVGDMNQLLGNVRFDYGCSIMKVHTGQPILDFYFGAQKNALYLGYPPGFYQDLEYILNSENRTGKCFYYYFESYREFDYLYEGTARIERQRVDEIFSSFSCNSSVEYENKSQERPLSLVKYMC